MIKYNYQLLNHLNLFYSRNNQIKFEFYYLWNFLMLKMKHYIWFRQNNIYLLYTLIHIFLYQKLI